MSAFEQHRDCVLRALARAREAGADAADAVLVEDDSLEARVRGTEIDFVSQAKQRCLGVRALVRDAGSGGLRSAIASTTDLSADTVLGTADQAVALARHTAPDPHAGLPEEAPATEIPDLELFDPADRNVSVEARIDDARRAEAAARAFDPRIENSEGSQATSHFSSVTYGHSNGFLEGYESASHAIHSMPIARENGSMQRDAWFSTGRRLSDLEDPGAVGRQAAERALRRLGSRRIPTCEAPVIFDSLTASSLVAQLASCLSGYSVYRKASFLAESMGETIAAASVSVIDDGRKPGGLGSKPFDGEGLATRRNRLIEDGRLSSWLLDSYSGRKLGLPSTGNAARGAGSAPGVAASNLWIEPGEASLDDLVAGTKRGLLVTELIGMGFNPVTGDYSRGAAGLWIENFEIAFPVEEITIAGNFREMLRGIDGIGSEILWRSRMASPPLRIAAMQIAGE